MQVNYEILTNIVFQHQYFTNKRLDCLGVTPSKESECFMLNNGLICKTFKDGFTLLYQTDINGEVRSREELHAINGLLRFHIILRDPNFYNYTESGMKSLNDSLYYFHNIPSKRKNPFSWKFLHEGEYVSEADILTLEQPDEYCFQKLFALIDVQINNELQREFAISFKQKQSYWRYILMGEHLKELHKPAIVGERAIFNGPLTQLLPNKDVVVYFESNKPIGLSQIPTDHFKLVENYEEEALGHRVVIRQLPTPNVSSISTIKENSNEEKIEYSEIFIY